MKRVFFLLVSLASIFNIFAGTKCDSIRIELYKTDNPYKQYEILINLVSCLKDDDAKSAMEYAIKAIDISATIDDPVMCANANVIMADLLYNTDTYASAINYYTTAIESFEKLDDYKTISELYIKIADAYQNGEFEVNWSVETMTKAVDCAQKSGSKEVMIKAFLAFGQIYQIQGKLSEANNYYSKVIEFPIDKITIRYIANALSNMSSISIQQSDYDKAIKMADSSLYLCIRDGYDEFIILNYGYKAEVCDSLRMIDDAEKYYRKSIDLAKSLNDVNNCAKYCYALGKHYAMFNDNDEAIDLIRRVCDSAIKYKLYDYAQNSFRFLANQYAGKGEFESAYDSYKLYDAYHDSSYYDWENKKIVQQRTSYLTALAIKEYNIKNKELMAIKQSESFRFWVFVFAMMILVIVIVFIIVFWRIYLSKQKQKQELLLRQSELTETQANMMEMQLKNNRDSLVNLALHLRSYIEFIQNLKDDIKALTLLPPEKQSPKIKEVLVNLQQNIQLHQNMEELENKINEVYKDFFDRLDQKYPDLTKSDRKLCAMLRMNMTTKEIAFLTNTSVRAVETARYRLRKKFDIQSTENMIDFIQNF